MPVHPYDRIQRPVRAWAGAPRYGGELAEQREWKPKELFMAVRVAVTGRAATPPLFETMLILGKEVCRRRLRSALDTLRGMTG